MNSTEDKLIILDALTSYYLALDAFTDSEAIAAFFTRDAVWECYHFKASTPAIAFRSIAELRNLPPQEAQMARAARLRHHISGTVFRNIDSDAAETLTKVLVTIQPNPEASPQVRETALVSASWRKEESIWKISQWRIDRDSSN